MDIGRQRHVMHTFVALNCFQYFFSVVMCCIPCC